jgi:hypothetical protein
MPASMRLQRRNTSREEVKAALFAVGLMCFLLVLVVMLFSAGPIILGTEMNTNGQVEYLCLGSGCESLYQMRWSD